MDLPPSDDDWQHYNDWKERESIKLVRKDYYTPLPWGTADRSEKNFQMVRFLVKHDLKSINDQNSQGITVLMLAASNSLDARSARLLIENGAKTDICDNEGRMALHFASRSGNAELLQYILEHTEQSYIEQWFMNAANRLQARCPLPSFVGAAICSENMKCLEILLTSTKLSKSILQAPIVLSINLLRSYRIFSPITILLNDGHYYINENHKSLLRLLFKHEITTLDEFNKVHKVEWPQAEVEFMNPFYKFFHFMSLSEQLYYFQWLNENDVTIDYCLQYYHNNTQPFATFTDYRKYYNPVGMIIQSGNTEVLKQIMCNSAILEPDELIFQFKDSLLNFAANFPFKYRTTENCKFLTSFEYLINLKPIYYNLVRLNTRNEAGENLSFWYWYPYSTISEEFSKVTLQQLCRTTIRQHVRGYSLADNLQNFRRNILQLGLPAMLEDYLLFKF